jgi:ABC-type bacteriocin/lantibiotic exporter with double-glycine peptidase domain
VSFWREHCIASQRSFFFLDEATAHLDVEMEKQVYENLRVLKITRVCNAHRPAVLAYADKIFNIAGQPVALGKPTSARLARSQTELVAAAGPH